MPLTVTPPYKRIYFDSNLLIAANWPSLGQAIQNLFTLAKFLDSACVLLNVVEKELGAHWKRDCKKTQVEALGKIANLQKLGAQIGMGFSMQQPKESDIFRAYSATVDRLVAEQSLVRAKPTLRHTAEFFEMAIHHVRPFKEKGKNFQDAVICLAAVDDLASLPNKCGALVTRDDIYDQKTLDKFCRPAGVSLKLFETQGALMTDLKSHLQASILQEWVEEEKRAMTAVRAHCGEMESFIVKNLEISSRIDMIDRIISINGIEIGEISKVEVPMPREMSPGQPVTITATIDLTIYATVRRHRTSPGVSPRIKVGDRSYFDESLFRANKTEECEEALGRTVFVEMLATREEDTYTGLEFLSVRLGSKSAFGKLGSILGPAHPIAEP